MESQTGAPRGPYHEVGDGTRAVRAACPTR